MLKNSPVTHIIPNRQRWTGRLCFLALLLTLSLTSLKQTASAQTCFEQCQQTYLQCVQSSPPNPALCDDRYDDCLVGCM
ncbi:MAG: hypothetical protein WBV94_31500 [Blastocatellia bacterium]